MSGDHPAKQLGESAIVQVSALELLWADLQKLSNLISLRCIISSPYRPLAVVLMNLNYL